MGALDIGLAILALALGDDGGITRVHDVLHRLTPKRVTAAGDMRSMVPVQRPGKTRERAPASSAAFGKSWPSPVSSLLTTTGNPQGKRLPLLTTSFSGEPDMPSVFKHASLSAAFIAALCMVFTSLTVATAPEAKAWTDAEKRISYIATAPDGVGQVFTMRPDGSDPRQITTTPRKKCDPAFSPDGTEIAYASSDGNFYVTPATGGAPVTIYQGVEDEGGRRPTWSKDGNTIVFHVSVNSNDHTTPSDQVVINLWMVQRTSKDSAWQPPVQLTNLQSAAYYARFSPDGERILYTHRQLGSEAKADLWVMPAPGPPTATTSVTPVEPTTQPPGQRITTNAGALMASWAPSGNQIAYTAACGTGLFVAPVTTSADGKITAGTAKLVFKGTCEATWSSHSETLITVVYMGKVQRLDLSGSRPKATALRTGSQPGW